MNLERYRKSYEELEAIQQTKNLDFYAYPAKYYCKPFRIAGNLYYIGDQRVCSHLVDTGDGLLVFDSGFPCTTHLMIQAIWELGFDPKDVKVIIHSHEHFDHIGGACEFRELFGTKLAISRAGAEVMKDHPEQVYMEFSEGKHSPIFTPDILLEDGAVFTLGNTSVRCVHTPGHSEGVMSFFFRIKEGDATYDVGYFGGAGFNTLYKKALEKSGRPLSTQQQFLDSLRKVREEKVDIVLGNHPHQNETLKKREEMLAHPEKNPFLDPTEWKTFCDTMTDSFQQFLAMGH